MRTLIEEERKPFISILKEEIGETESLLYRRGNFNGTWDDLICNAIIEERGADIALSPGFRWGPSLIPGSKITVEDIYNATAMSYPKVYLTEMTGNTLKIILEDVADNLFNPDPYYQQGGDMVRVGGMGYRIDINKKQGNRISEMTMLKTGDKIEPEKSYKVGGWASVNENTEGPHDILRAIQMGICDGFGLKLTRLGGVNPFVTVRDLCEIRSLPHTCEDTWGGDIVAAACVQVAATIDPKLMEAVWIAGTYIEENYDPENGIRVVNGHIKVPTGPGLGITPDEKLFGEPISSLC